MSQNDPLPFYAPLIGWEKQWTSPRSLPDAQPTATLGSRPGNISKPQPNHYRVRKWVKVPNKPKPYMVDPLPPVLISPVAVDLITSVQHAPISAGIVITPTVEASAQDNLMVDATVTHIEQDTIMEDVQPTVTSESVKMDMAIDVTPAVGLEETEHSRVQMMAVDAPQLEDEPTITIPTSNATPPTYNDPQLPYADPVSEPSPEKVYSSSALNEVAVDTSVVESADLSFHAKPLSPVKNVLADASAMPSCDSLPNMPLSILSSIVPTDVIDTGLSSPKPLSSSMPVSPEKKPFSELSMLPATTMSEKPASPVKSAAFERPASPVKYAAFEKPASSVKSAAFEKPASPVKSAAFENPASPVKSTTFEKPASPVKSTTFEKPASPVKSTTFEKPASPVKSAAFEKPASPVKYAAFEKPASPVKSATFERPASPVKSATFEMPLITPVEFVADLPIPSVCTPPANSVLVTTPSLSGDFVVPAVVHSPIRQMSPRKDHLYVRLTSPAKEVFSAELIPQSSSPLLGRSTFSEKPQSPSKTLSPLREPSAEAPASPGKASSPPKSAFCAISALPMSEGVSETLHFSERAVSPEKISLEGTPISPEKASSLEQTPNSPEKTSSLARDTFL
ncbi:hypothetical protein BASA50_008591 [Batrachochytrium salamandrivorans]|uniref:Uncharacterized protein n=1 Tax=Batrachochytrium salamandrivorans TaxID=1357716 RepID=A0ABQ8F3P3_9FUNG|nr:hypothetical protein BASA50_008591 [Batrachochytrium salamandrivorans]